MNKENLEMLFRAQVEKAQKEIEEQMKIAREAVNKACDISEKYGVPFYGISEVTQAYGPSEHISDKFLNEYSSEFDIDEYSSEFDIYELMQKLIEEYNIYKPEYEGWQHSAIC